MWVWVYFFAADLKREGHVQPVSALAWRQNLSYVWRANQPWLARKDVDTTSAWSAVPDFSC